MMMAATRDDNGRDYYTREPLINFRDPAVRMAAWIVLSIPFLLIMFTGYHRETVGDPNAWMWLVGAMCYVVLVCGIRLVVLFFQAMLE